MLKSPRSTNRSDEMCLNREGRNFLQTIGSKKKKKKHLSDPPSNSGVNSRTTPVGTLRKQPYHIKAVKRNFLWMH